MSALGLQYACGDGPTNIGVSRFRFVGRKVPQRISGWRGRSTAKHWGHGSFHERVIEPAARADQATGESRSRHRSGVYALDGLNAGRLRHRDHRRARLLAHPLGMRARAAAVWLRTRPPGGEHLGVQRGAENLHFSDIDVPAPGAGQLAIAVDTAGVNYLDIYQRNGAARAPFVAGVEGVGRVTEAGADVDTALVGRRVGWLAGQGSFANTVVVDAATMTPSKPGVSSRRGRFGLGRSPSVRIKFAAAPRLRPDPRTLPYC